MQQYRSRLVILLTAFWLLTSKTSFAQQDFTVTGKVLDTQGKPVVGAKVSIENSAFTDTNENGYFSITLSKPIEQQPKEVRVLRRHMRIKDVKYLANARDFRIQMQDAPGFFQGQVLSAEGEPQPAADVVIKVGGQSETVATDAKGFFFTRLPEDVPLTKDISFTVNNVRIPPDKIKIFPNAGFVILRTAKQPPATTANKPALENNKKNEIVSVTVYDESYLPIPNLKLKVDGITYTTDNEGKFVIKASQVDVSKFSIEGYEIAKFDFDTEGNYVFIVIKSETAGKPIIPMREALDSTVINYRDDFYSIINELELRKQILSEKSNQIRSEMERVAEKLNNQPDITPSQRENLKKYLKNLEIALIENDVAYEDAQQKSQELIARLKSTILEKDDQISAVESQKQITIQILYVVGFIAFILLLAIIFGYQALRKINQQKQEIERQRDEITQAYNNIKTLSAIGQKITATLDFKALISTIHSNVISLLDATIFGVGVFNEAEQKIEFMDFMASGRQQSYHFESMNGANHFSVWCLKNRKEVIINNLAVDYAKYLNVASYQVTDDMPKSLLYLPLIRENKAIGVITVQSLKPNAYSEIDLKVLSTLASYISIALDNSNAYEIIRRKNRDITDSIRYAQTIQEAMLPGKAQMQEVFGEHFVIFRPKDIVSGDFYWLDRLKSDTEDNVHVIPTLSDVGNKVFFATIDCTGHGVPGGFMTLIANQLLNEMVSLRKIHDPAMVIELMDRKIRNILKQQDRVNDDGMDASLALMERMADGKMRIVYAGARRPLYFFVAKENKLYSLKGDRASIGGPQRKDARYNRYEIILNKGDMIYMLTDGFADQNNPDKQKFGTKNLCDMLELHATKPADQQKSLIEASLDAHMNGSEQRDDITVIGIRI
ncbi:MAG: SpoIIE family protein phosphatase [Cytophagales bacterium]|nr:SpoIIE family protein phosphatase [Bernardetiaceae bacterium]MDW8204996.1 SpoIIE family protein phosphatase [Cytophagales bacterium]